MPYKLKDDGHAKSGDISPMSKVVDRSDWEAGVISGFSNSRDYFQKNSLVEGQSQRLPSSLE